MLASKITLDLPKNIKRNKLWRDVYRPGDELQ
jgi:hypothetical protein